MIIVKEVESYLGIELEKLENESENDLWDNTYVTDDHNNLTHLCVSQVKISQLSILCEILKRSPSLKDLYFDSLEAISSLDLISQLTNIETLRFNSTKILNQLDFRNFTNLKQLYFYDIEFINLSDFIGCEKLISLELSGINTILYDEQFSLETLKSLEVSFCNTIDFTFLSNFKDLKFLEISNCNLMDIPSIENLDQLISLSLRGNNLKEIPYERLINLNKLKYLNIGGNNIEDISFLKYLNKLESLWLIENFNISDFTPISKLNNLNSISCGKCNLKNIEFLTNLKKLKRIDLQDNAISDIEPLKDLEIIERLNLANNKIKKIEKLKCILTLQKFDISRNLLTEFPRWILETQTEITWKDYSFGEKTTNVYENSFNNIPIEIIRLGKDSIIRYFKKIDSEGAEVIYEVKLTLVGEGGAGKTSLKRRLINEHSSLPRKDKRTRGIEIRDWTFKEVKNVKHKAHIWDFGGQDVYYPVHRFFITENSLFILLASTRQQQHNFEYWIPTIYQFGGNSPIILAQTCHDGNGKNWNDLGAFTSNENFNIIKTQIKPYYELNLPNNNKGLLKLKRIIIDQIINLNHYGKRVPKTWSAIRNKLKTESKQSSCITFDRFSIICKSINKNSFENNKDVVDCCNFLHSIGVLIWYSKNETLKNWVVLEPQWAMNAVYLIIDDEEIQKRKGIILNKDFSRLWSNEDYINKEFVLKKMLESFKIAFPKKHSSSEYLMPARMDSMPPENKWKIPKPYLNVIFKFKFMPKGILNQVSAELSRYIENENSVWNDAVNLLYEDDKTSAHIYEDFYNREIIVKSIGPNDRGFMMIIIDAVKQVVSEYRGVENEILVPCICRRCEEMNDPTIFKYEKLVDWFYSRKNVAVTCNESGEQFLISELLHSVGLDKSLKIKSNQMYDEKKKMTRIFISYSKYDENYLQDMEDHLVTLKSEGLATFNCRQIDFGDKWDDRIKKEIDECDIMICLISVKFLNTDYINKIEIEKAIKQNKIIVPIVIKACDWESSSLGKYQAAQRGKVVSLDNNEKLLGRIKSNTEEERAAFWTDIIKELRAKLF
ncbi:leucine rich repeat (LRR) protein [Nonlabens dokdonensis]|uniref:non-specific serine/threonine protein kinase n=2 Tax=Nonlabens dokdonensis TaxID=328515 RepID=L7W2S5_NONDD|nr:COR domain-containing protein [Nonlabens dokdonensis]AGC75785.1 Miro domain protein [Nonlabens dokdonensis DSW-6]PZX43467.1 leucine rich repeat (LRR) protein [Nonlabens dokdonensis]